MVRPNETSKKFEKKNLALICNKIESFHTRRTLNNNYYVLCSE